jgi:hypothetical protein
VVVKKAIQKCLESQIGKNVDAYVDNMVVKTTAEDNLIVDLAKTFAYLQHYCCMSQILADFVSEWTETQQPPSAEKPEHWKMYFGGTLNLEGAGAGVLFISPRAIILSTSYRSTTRRSTMALSTRP